MRCPTVCRGRIISADHYYRMKLKNLGGYEPYGHLNIEVYSGGNRDSYNTGNQYFTPGEVVYDPTTKEYKGSHSTWVREWNTYESSRYASYGYFEHTF